MAQKVVHKFSMHPLDAATFVDIEMPVDARVLSCQVQYHEQGIICLWAEVSPDAPKRKRRFKVYGTGHPLDDFMVHNYIGTVLLQGGGLVLHVYEVFPR